MRIIRNLEYNQTDYNYIQLSQPDFENVSMTTPKSDLASFYQYSNFPSLNLESYSPSAYNDKLEEELDYLFTGIIPNNNNIKQKPSNTPSSTDMNCE